MSYCTQGETEKTLQGPGRFEREVEPILLSLRLGSFISAFTAHHTLQIFTFRKRTAMNAMVKVTITLAYSSVGNFSRVGKKPCEKR